MSSCTTRGTLTVDFKDVSTWLAEEGFDGHGDVHSILAPSTSGDVQVQFVRGTSQRIPMARLVAWITRTQLPAGLGMHSVEYGAPVSLVPLGTSMQISFATRSDGLSQPNACGDQRLCNIECFDSGSAAPLNSERSGFIRLTPPFVARDRNGVVWGVKGLEIHRSGVTPDVLVLLDRAGAIDAMLCEDQAFLACVFRALTLSGYDGPRFGRAEMGCQSDRTVVLEPTSAFHEFAQRRGFNFIG